MLKRLVRGHKAKYLGYLGICILLCIPFLYALGNTALMSYDEAWYAEIARNILLTHNPLHLMFNGVTYVDHPPLGFILMSLVMRVFGYGELSVRLLSSLLGVGAVMVTYGIGKRLYGRSAGLISAGVLFSSMWFMYRARSGNLDVPFIFWEVLTVAFALYKGKRWLYLTGICCAALFLTKTLVGAGVLPLLLYMVWVRRKEVAIKSIVGAVVLTLALILPWYIYNQMLDPHFLYHHFVEIGARGSSNTYSMEALRSSLLYLSIGVGKWYKVFLVAVGICAVAFGSLKKVRFSVAVLFLWLLGFTPFLLSSKTEIWHLLPLYPAVAIVCAVGLLIFVQEGFPQFRYAKYGVVAVCLALALYQFKQFSPLIYSSSPQFSAEKDISLKSAQYPTVYLMDLFYPAAVYYSGHAIFPLRLDERAYQKMVDLLKTDQAAVFIINPELKTQLEKDAVLFAVLDKNVSYLLISFLQK